MSYVEVFQIVFLVIVFAVGLVGFIKAAIKEDEKS